jgi:uncharacterized membrane protein
MQIAAVIFTCLLLPLAGHAQAAKASLRDWNIDISINDDKTSEWTVSYSYLDYVQRSDFFLLPGATAFNVTADGRPVNCAITRGIGTSIVCQDINAKEIVYRIRTFPVINSLQNLNIFTNRISVTQITDKFSVTIRLPFGTALADSSELEGTGLNPTEPADANQGSDGRRIFVVWNYQNPKLGTTNDYTAVFETARQTDFSVFIIIISAIIIGFLIFLIFFFSRRNVRNMLPVLTDNERKVMEMVLREKQIDQRKIVKETDFSKAKVSRILQDLKNRGLIEKKLKGRTNIISLKKSGKREKTGGKENEDKKG